MKISQINFTTSDLQFYSQPENWKLDEQNYRKLLDQAIESIDVQDFEIELTLGKELLVRALMQGALQANIWI